VRKTAVRLARTLKGDHEEAGGNDAPEAAPNDRGMTYKAIAMATFADLEDRRKERPAADQVTETFAVATNMLSIDVDDDNKKLANDLIKNVAMKRAADAGLMYAKQLSFCTTKFLHSSRRSCKCAASRLFFLFRDCSSCSTTRPTLFGGRHTRPNTSLVSLVRVDSVSRLVIDPCRGINPSFK